MLSNANGPLGIKIEPTIGPKSLTKFFNSKWKSLESKASCIYAHSNQMFQSHLPFGFLFNTMEKTKKI
jgi:hypothetical protein